MLPKHSDDLHQQPFIPRPIKWILMEREKFVNEEWTYSESIFVTKIYIGFHKWV